MGGQHFIKFPWAEGSHGTFGALVTGGGPLWACLIFVLSGALELAWRESPEKEPGNFGDPLGLNMYNTEMRSKELNNGRMAMISVLVIFPLVVACFDLLRSLTGRCRRKRLRDRFPL